MAVPLKIQGHEGVASHQDLISRKGDREKRTTILPPKIPKTHPLYADDIESKPITIVLAILHYPVGKGKPSEIPPNKNDNDLN